MVGRDSCLPVEIETCMGAGVCACALQAHAHQPTAANARVACPRPAHTPVAEGAALHVLATQPHVVALAQQRGICQCLCHAPVEALARINHVAPRLVHLLDLLVGHEVRRELGDGVAHLLQQLHVHACATPQACIKEESVCVCVWGGRQEVR